MLDIKAMASEVVRAMREHIAAKFAPLDSRVGAVEKALSELPQPEQGLKGDRGDDAPPVDVTRLAAEVFALVPVPKNGEPGEPGQSVSVDDVTPIIREAVTREVAALPPAEKADPAEIAGILLRAIAEMPKPEPVDIAAVAAHAAALVPVPKDGEDGQSVTLDDVRPLVLEIVAALPGPKEVDPVVIEQRIQVAVDAAKAEILAHADQAIEAMPKPDPAAIAADVLEQVTKALEQIPVPQDGEPGKDADPEVIKAEISKAFAALPPAEKGADADPAVIATMVANAVAEIEIPTPKEVDPAVIRAEVERAMAEIPKPRDGENVPLEVTQALVAGEVAKAFAAMTKPKDGEPGRDALQLDIQPMIDETKSYPRNSLAWHRGGYWHAVKNTSGMDGWVCQMKGIVEESEELQADARTIVRKTTYSDGSVWERAIKQATTLYRGVWKENEDYERGDQTTRQGAQWTLMADRQTGKPGDDASGWVMSSKSGRDGKDGLRGEKGDRGAEGRPGKDLTQMSFDGKKY